MVRLAHPSQPAPLALFPLPAWPAFSERNIRKIATFPQGRVAGRLEENLPLGESRVAPPLPTLQDERPRTVSPKGIRRSEKRKRIWPDWLKKLLHVWSTIMNVRFLVFLAMCLTAVGCHKHRTTAAYCPCPTVAASPAPCPMPPPCP